MEKIIWNEKVFSVGHPLMDEQHRILVGLINQFIDLSSSGVTPKEIQRHFIKMVQYAMYHFGAEEMLLSSVSSSMLEDHKKSHDQFAERAIDALMSCDGQNIDQAIKTFTDLWTNHVQVMDMEYRPLFIGY